MQNNQTIHPNIMDSQINKKWIEYGDIFLINVLHLNNYDDILLSKVMRGVLQMTAIILRLYNIDNWLPSRLPNTLIIDVNISFFVLAVEDMEELTIAQVFITLELCYIIFRSEWDILSRIIYESDNS